MEILYLPVLLLLTFDKDYRVVKVLLDQMLTVVLPQNLNHASEVVVWAANKLVFTDITMLLDVLSKDFRSTLVVTIDNFVKTPLIMCLQILVHDD